MPRVHKGNAGTTENKEEAEMLPVEPEEAAGQARPDLGENEAPEMAAKISEKDANQDDGFQPVPDAGVTALESLIASSKEPDEKLFEEKLHEVLYEPSNSNLIAMPTPEEITAITMGDRIPIPDFVTPLGTDNTITVGPVIGIGPQPNGDYGVVVTVPEQMVSGVLGQAELDGVSPSEWLSVRLADFLEGWFHGK